MQLPFEMVNLGHPWEYNNLGFGTYLAYFSRLISNPTFNFLMNEAGGMTEEEEEIRHYMSLVMSNLTQEQQMQNISIWEFAKYLHANPDEKVNRKYFFARQLQNEFNCWFPKSRHFMVAWESYSKAYFAD